MNAATASEIMMSSTFNGPFLEENEVSGQVVKSIYVEDQIYDSQIQYTGQAMLSCAAVKLSLKRQAPLQKLILVLQIPYHYVTLKYHSNIILIYHYLYNKIALFTL